MADGKLGLSKTLFICDWGAHIRSRHQYEALFGELAIPKYSCGLKVYRMALDLHRGSAGTDGPAWMLRDVSTKPGSC